ncbi:hypothetical protein EJ03DRAFT_323717 [Teratosphaeria nubilosa]|uniref:Uncharacterized protein n=1 Tax=Teratosphaeria nubilosa TaxID=161662 RepID=A0A6G1LKR9_9PEZI|nr:hypothetical protein EJ03DRAFT_323717 [Teratosphaeria nubilosa]
MRTSRLGPTFLAVMRVTLAHSGIAQYCYILSGRRRLSITFQPPQQPSIVAVARSSRVLTAAMNLAPIPASGFEELQAAFPFAPRHPLSKSWTRNSELAF